MSDPASGVCNPGEARAAERYRAYVLLTITLAQEQATDLGFLLGKHPDRVHHTELAWGRATVCFPVAEPDRCTAALIVEIDPDQVVRRLDPSGSTDGFTLGQYVNDRPYAASSLLSVAISRALGSALHGRCRERPELAAAALPLELAVPAPAGPHRGVPRRSCGPRPRHSGSAAPGEGDGGRRCRAGGGRQPRGQARAGVAGQGRAALARARRVPGAARRRTAGVRRGGYRVHDGLLAHYVLDGGRLVVAHAGLHEQFHGRASRRVRAFALYGETTGESDEFGLPVRYPWALEYRGAATVVYGHTPVPEAEWVNNTIPLRQTIPSSTMHRTPGYGTGEVS